MSNVLLAIGCWVGVTILVLILDNFSTRRRVNSLSDKARELGFEFTAMDRPFRGTDVRGLTALEEDDFIVVSDVLKGTSESGPMLIFNLLGCGDFSVDVALTTCAAFRCPSGKLPICQIAAKDLIERLREAVARKPELFEIDHEFSTHFSVHCANAATPYFDRRRLAHLRAHADAFRIECSPEWILVYRPGVKVSSDLPKFIRETSTLVSALMPKESLELPAA